jgi:pyruvate dehydrogenase E1 component alpha subunit
MRLLIVRNFPMVTSKHHWEDEMATRKSATAASRKKPAEKSGLNGGITEFDKETELEAYREMLLIRRFEEKAGQLYGMGFIGGFCHLYIGQEAVVVGMQMALKDGDQVITGYRDHGHMLATGMEARGVMAELTGRQGGYSRGKGGSMHMFSKDKNFYGGHGIVGAPGVARHRSGLRQQVSRQRQCLRGLFRRWRGQPGPGLREFQHGGAVEAAGDLHCREQPLRHGHVDGSLVGPVELLAARQLLRHPWHQVDGMDVRAVHAAAVEAVAHCRSGKGPIILEMLTYRYRGHSMSDPAKYRSKDEVQKMRSEHDPIEQVKARLLELKHASEDDLKAIDKKVRDVVADSADFAQNNPEPDPSELYTDILL